MPQRWKGGRQAAQDRYRRKNRSEINARQRAAYAANPKRAREQQQRYRSQPQNRARILAENRAWSRQYRLRLRAELLEAYGSCCECCGEAEPSFLQLDHIHGGGTQERRKHGRSTAEFVRYLKAKGWPQEGYRLLCANCNVGRERNGGVCPHKKEPASAP